MCFLCGYDIPLIINKTLDIIISVKILKYYVILLYTRNLINIILKEIEHNLSTNDHNS